jgi:hypothetical protein
MFPRPLELFTRYKHAYLFANNEFDSRQVEWLTNGQVVPKLLPSFCGYAIDRSVGKDGEAFGWTSSHSSFHSAKLRIGFRKKDLISFRMFEAAFANVSHLVELVEATNMERDRFDVLVLEPCTFLFTLLSNLLYT